ncbi:DUF642 domain-containing protein [Photobacterium japonica]|uniref:DUF642 domain-containing protein n=1 Tax=Photobacterium japonica TaxID=2910235 RepID=UPI003D0BEA2F
MDRLASYPFDSALIKKGIGIGLLLSVTLFSAFSQANLIQHGSFEEPDVGNKKWRYFAPATTPGLSGWQGDNIEIWDSLFGFESSHGDQHAELNAHPNQGSYFSIYQTFATNPSQLYTLSFDYAARRNSGESFFVKVMGDTPLLLTTLADHERFTWRHYSETFYADSDFSTLRFVSKNKGTRGNLLDNIHVTVVPEPDLLFPVLLLVVFLLTQRRLRKFHG